MKKIYILHGWTYTLEAWGEAASLLATAGFEPVLLRVPGLTAPTDHPWTLDAYVEWLSSELPIEPVALAGHSNGGRIALAFAAKNPGRVSRLVLIDAAGIVHNGPILRFKRALFGGVAAVGKRFTSSVLLRKIFYRLISARDYGRAPEHMRETMANLISIDLRDRLASIHAPTLIIWGGKDSSTPPSDADLMHRGISGSKLVMIPAAGHSPHKTHAEQVVREIAAFIP